MTLTRYSIHPIYGMATVVFTLADIEGHPASYEGKEVIISASATYGCMDISSRHPTKPSQRPFNEGFEETTEEQAAAYLNNVPASKEFVPTFDPSIRSTYEYSK